MVWSLSQIHWAAESTGDGSPDSQLLGVSTGRSALGRSSVCLARLIPSLFIFSWPFLCTILDPRLNTPDYMQSHRYFGSSHRWSIKHSSPHSTLITLPLTLPLSLIQWFSSPPVLHADPADLHFQCKCALFQQHRVASAWDVIRIKDIDHMGPDCGSINNSQHE